MTTTSALTSRREAFFKADGTSVGSMSASTTTTTGTTGLSAYEQLKMQRLAAAGLTASSLTTPSYSQVGSTQLGQNGSSYVSSTSSSASAQLAPSDGYVGFANLPNQVYRKAVKRGFEFNLMVVGQSGLGKTTMLNALFLTDLYAADFAPAWQRVKKTMNIESSTLILKENGVSVKLTLVDAPGFGDQIDNSNCWQPVIDYVDARFNDYLSAESKVNRPLTITDGRVHCCLYFIAPNGHGLRPIDIEFMKRLQDKVNLVVILAKADSMTLEECRDFKKVIARDLETNKIRTYDFPLPEATQNGSSSSQNAADGDEDRLVRKYRERLPFAVVGSNAMIERGGTRVHARVYPWGTVEVENLEHNDFLALRTVLVRTHLQDPRDSTHNVLYENFRYTKLSGIALESKFKTTDGKDPMMQMEDEKKEHELKMKRMEQEMEQVFRMKVDEKMKKLKQSEAELNQRAEQIRVGIAQQERELEDRRKAFEAERDTFEEQNKDYVTDRERRKSLDSNELDGGTLPGKGKEPEKQKKKKGLF